MSSDDDQVLAATGANIKAIRQELGLSQAQMARLVGYSTRAVQSVEQGWRQPGPALEKAALLLVMAHRHGQGIPNVSCWEIVNCPPERRAACITYRSGQGHLCWFLNGTLCTSQLPEWEQKRQACFDCLVFKMLLAGPATA